MFEKIEAYLKNDVDKISLYAEDLRTGEVLSIDGDRRFRSASLIKNIILWAFYQKLSSGEVQKEERYILKETDKVGETPFDTGVLRDFHSGIELTLEDVVTMMIVVSDDTATNIMIDRLGLDVIGEEIQKIGLKQTALQRRMMEYEKARRGIDNFTSARDMAELYRRMIVGDGISQEMGSEMLDILSKQRYTQGFPSKLPENIRIAHKTGNIGEFGLEHDVGVIYGPDGKPGAILCMLTEGLDDRFTKLGMTAKLVYEGLLEPIGGDAV